MGLNIFLTAPRAQMQVLYWEWKVFKASTVAPLDLSVLFSKARVALQDEIQMHLLKENWNKIKPHLRFTEISPLLPDTRVSVLLFGLCAVKVVNNL